MAAHDLIALIGLAITIVIVGLVILGSLRLSRWLQRSQPKPKPKPPVQTPPWIWIFLIVLVAVISYTVSGSNKPRGQPLHPPEASTPAWVFLLLYAGAIFGFLVVLYAVALYQNYDRASSKAIKLAKAGDPVGAIALLKAEIEVGKPSAIRFTTLGVLHSIREEWTEAYKAFLEAEAIGGRQAIHLSNLGVALLKLGRPVEAEPLLQEACALDPVSPLFACNLGRILAELGRPDEAASQLTIAEAAYKKLWSIPPSSKKPIGEEIDKLRLRLAGETSPATE